MTTAVRETVGWSNRKTRRTCFLFVVYHSADVDTIIKMYKICMYVIIEFYDAICILVYKSP